MAAGDTENELERVGEEGVAPYLDPSERAFWVGLSAMIASIVVSVSSYLILTGLTFIKPTTGVVWAAMATNAVLMGAMVWVIARQVRGLWRAWREKVAGSRLHIRIVALFSVIAAVPALLLAVAATTTFSRSLDSSYDRVRGIIDNSLNVARAYLDEHGQVIRTDILNMARDLDAAADAGEDESAVFDTTGDRADFIHGPGERHGAVARDSAKRRAQSCYAAAARWRDDAAECFGA